MAYQNSTLDILLLISFVANIILSILVYLKNRKSNINISFSIVVFGVAEWNLATFLFWNTDNPLFWGRMMFVGPIILAAAFLYFCFNFPFTITKFKRYYSPIIFGIIPLLFLYLTPSNFIVRKIIEPLREVEYGIGNLIFGIYFFTYMGIAFQLIIKKFLISKGLERVQIKYLVFGAVVSTIIGTFTNLVLPLLGTSVFNRVGPAATAIFTSFVAYTIIRHRLMAIEIVIKKTFIFAGLFTFVFGVFAAVTFLAQEFLIATMGHSTRYAILFFSVLLITIGIRPLETFLISITDKVLFQKKYDYQRILKEASEGMTLVTDMKKLLNFIVRVVSKSIRVKSAAIFQYEETKDKYVLRIRRGSYRKHTGYSLDKNNALVSWIKEHNEPVLCDEVEDWLESERFLRKEKGLREKLEALREELHDMGVSICVPSYSKGRLIGFLILGEKLSGDIYTQEDIHLLSTLASEAAIAVENAMNFMELEKLREKDRESYIQTVLALAQTVDEKDSYTHGHLEDVSYYGMRVAEELEESSEFKAVIDKEDLETGLRLHDIGKIGVPDAILNKNGKLKPEEWAIMKQHCEIGARIVQPLEKLKNVGNIIKHHQEKYDGTGYPDGLKGEEIPLESRIIAVVDSYHAMVSDRPYRRALPEQAALQELKNNIGTQFDPVVVGAFVRAWEKGKIKKI